MIDEHSYDRTGWARFSDDRRMRYRLGRLITTRELDAAKLGFSPYLMPQIRRVVFVMLNPSTADAFKLDPTVDKCRRFADRWGADVLEVVNIFALRSTDPRGLDAGGDVGDGPDNDAEILAACRGASRVIAAWGNHAHRWGRGAFVRSMLANEGIRLERLGSTKEGYPLHPLARGKLFIPLTREPEAWP